MATERPAKYVHEILDRVEHRAVTPRVSVAEIMDALGHRAYGSVYLFLALITLTPIGAIPGLSGITGTILVLLALQQIGRRKHPWLPRRVLNLSMERGRFETSVDRAKPLADRLDRYIRPRLAIFARRPFRLAAALVVVCLGLSMIVLEPIPFGADVPAAAVLLLGIGLTARDGLFILLGLVAAPATGWLLFRALPG